MSRRGGKEKKSLKKHTVNTVQALKHGDRSKRFQEFLKKHGIKGDPKELAVKDPQELINVLQLMDERDRQIRVYLDYFKSTGARGLALYDQYIMLQTEIAKKEQVMREQGESILDWDDYHKFVKLQLEIVKHLEKMKWDKEKFEQEQTLKRAESAVKLNEDDIFVVDAKFVEEQ